MSLQKEFDYFISHQKDIFKAYGNKVVVIKDSQVVGNYKSEADAITASRRLYAPGTFLVQRSGPDESVYTLHFSSPVVRFT